MTRILVTAAMGNVGREVARACSRKNLTVRVAGRDPARLAAAFPEHEAVKLDFLDRATWPEALAGSDQIFLLRPPPIGDMAATLLPFLDAAYASGARHVVFLSVAGADRMKWVPHRKVELHLAATNRGYTLLRPGFFAQNLEGGYRRDIVEDDRIYVPAGAGRVAFVDLRDVGAVAARVFEQPAAFQGSELTLTGPEALTFDQVAATLSRTLGRTVRYEKASIFGYGWHLRRSRGMPWAQIVVQTILHVGLRRGDAERVEPTVENVLGRPALSLEHYVDRAINAWRGAETVTPVRAPERAPSAPLAPAEPPGEESAGE